MLKELLRELADKSTDRAEESDDVVVDPPCELAFFVQFVDGRCPFSNLKSCDDCVCTEQDHVLITALKDDNIPKC